MDIRELKRLVAEEREFMYRVKGSKTSKGSKLRRGYVGGDLVQVKYDLPQVFFEIMERYEGQRGTKRS